MASLDPKKYPTEWNVFSQLDTDGDGVLSVEEFYYRLEELGNPQTAVRIMNLMDTNRDGIVTFEEFVVGYRAMWGKDRKSDQAKEAYVDIQASPLMDTSKREVIAAKTYKISDFNVTVGGVCQMGYYPDKKGYICQDNFAVVPGFEGQDDQMMMGVFDGHGKIGAGDAVSRLTRDLLPAEVAKLRKAAGTDKNKYESIEGDAAYFSAFGNVHKQCCKQLREKTDMAGTTAITVLLSGQTIHVANVGDSRAVLGRQAHGEWLAVELSKDQTPFRADERERIRRDFQDAEIMTMGMKEGDEPVSDDFGDEDDLLGAGSDPPRVWFKGEQYPGTAFTRSIGDGVAKMCGVIPDPEMVSRRLHEDDKMIVICSDGVFEFLSSEEVVQIVARYDDPVQAANELVNVSFDLWLQNDCRTDDISAIVCYLSDIKPSVGEKKWQVARSILPSVKQRPALRMQKAVQQAVQNKRQHDKDFYVLDMLMKHLDYQARMQKKGQKIRYD